MPSLQFVRDQLWARVYADALQRKATWFDAAELADMSVRAFERSTALTTPPAPQQPEALAQQERDSGEQWSIWKLMLDALLNVRMSIRFKSLSPEQQQQIDAAIRAARSSEGDVA